jgi:hypothetical protein
MKQTKEERAAYRKTYVIAHKEKIAAKNKIWWAAYRETSRAYSRKYNATHKKERAAAKKKHKYGLTAEQFDQMVQDQGGACRICGIVPTGVLHIDHDHETGKIRGLLCGKCNKGIGLLGDDHKRLLRAALYLSGVVLT